MFDDPNKELRELEDRLLAVEAPRETSMLDEQEFEALYDEILSEYGQQDDHEPPVRNFANGYGRPVVPEAPRPQTVPLTPDTQDRGGNAGLIFTICLEIAAIAAVVIFWILSLLGG